MFCNSLSLDYTRARALAAAILSTGLISCLFAPVANGQYVEPESQVELSTDGVLEDQEEEGKQESEAEKKPPHQLILEYREIEPTVDSISDYLRSQQPDHPTQLKLAETARGFIEKLGDENYRVRLNAREQLGKMTTLPIAELKSARSSPDPEVRATAAMLLDYAKKRAARDSLNGITKAVCHTIVDQQIKGLVNDLILAVSLFDDDDKATHQWLREAIIASAETSDLPTLETMVADSKQVVRITGVRGIVNLQGEDCSDMLIGLLQDKDEQVKLIAARELANIGKRESLDALIGLMKSEVLNVRMASNRALRALTAKNFAFHAFEESKKRTVALKSWTEWVAREGAKAELHFPLVEKKVVLGRILLTDYSANKVVELDLDGKELWSATVSSPWGVEGLPNGHRLVGLYSGNAIVEYDSDGEEVARIEGIPSSPMGFCRLENGNTLVAASESGKILEYDTKGEVVWENQIGGRPTDIKMLENGNMIVALMDQSKIVEVDREGERVLEIDTETSPLQVQVTERGTFITAHSSLQFAVEYNRKGEVVRKVDIGKSVTGAREMSNGDWIMATSDSIRRQSPDGNVVWEYKELTYCYNVCPF